MANDGFRSTFIGNDFKEISIYARNLTENKLHDIILSELGNTIEAASRLSTKTPFSKESSDFRKNINNMFKKFQQSQDKFIDKAKLCSKIAKEAAKKALSSTLDWLKRGYDFISSVFKNIADTITQFKHKEQKINIIDSDSVNKFNEFKQSVSGRNRGVER